jgi:hypothetical protein
MREILSSDNDFYEGMMMMIVKTLKNERMLREKNVKNMQEK